MHSPSNNFLYHCWFDDTDNPPKYLGHVRAWYYHEARLKARETFKVKLENVVILMEGETSEYYQVPKGVEHET